MTAAEQLTRIVALVAEGTRAEEREEQAPTLDELGRRFDVPPSQIADDLRVLTTLAEASDAEWLLSLSVVQQGDRLSVASAGPFRRPIRLSAEEFVAVQLALALEPGGLALACRLAALGRGAASPPAAASPAGEPDRDRGEDRHSVLMRAVAERRKLELSYAGEGDRTAVTWVVHPHQVVEARGRTYLVAWCEGTADWRHFRADRVLDARVSGAGFAPREDFVALARPSEVFRGSAARDPVTLRFSPRIARWARERYPDHEEEPGGSVLVKLPVANPAWLVRRVLEYGAEVEVVEPAAYREAVRRAVRAGIP